MQSFRDALFISLEHDHYSKDIFYAILRHQEKIFVFYDRRYKTEFYGSKYNDQVCFYELDQANLVKELTSLIASLRKSNGANMIVCWAEKPGWSALETKMRIYNLGDSFCESELNNFTIYDLWEIYSTNEKKISKLAGVSVSRRSLFSVSNALSQSICSEFKSMKEEQRIILEQDPTSINVSDMVRDYLELHITCMKNILNHLLRADYIKWKIFKMDELDD
jgi:hypothetical protein